jgi:hypothetical protein
MPKLAYGEEPEKTDTPTTQLGINDQVAGEELPDFSFIDGNGDSHADDGGKPASGEPPATSDAPAGKEATAGAPPKIPALDPNEEIEIPAVRPERETGEQPIPDPEEQAKAAADKKKADEEGAAAKAAEEAAKAAKPKEETKAPEVKLPTEEELEAMQPKPGAPRKVIEDFKKLKDEVVKPALSEVKRLKAELDAAKAAPVISEEIKAKLAQAEEDRQYREAHQLEKDPVLAKQFDAKKTEAEDQLFKFLQEHPRLKMSPESAKELREMGLDTPEGRTARQEVLKAVKKLDDDMLLDEVKEAFRKRDAVDKEREAKVAELRSKQGGITAVMEEREKEERMEWANKCNFSIIEQVKGKPEFLVKDIPATATPAEKAAIEAHNKELAEKIVPEFHAGIRAIHARDPEKGMKMLVDSLRLPKVEAALKEKETALADALKRIAELEGDSTRMRRISTPSHLNGAPPPAKGKEAADTSDLAAEQSIEQFMNERGLK